MVMVAQIEHCMLPERCHTCLSVRVTEALFAAVDAAVCFVEAGVPARVPVAAREELERAICAMAELKIEEEELLA